ncbi:DUF4411 family protein [Macrococcoides goetzii]|uniref:DUF4411 family protein n=1 Tax=Macrococcoides goetzii TaxID=1891097 RepID=A0A2G5NSW1_9STAP|nr:DUF4411 family protein [Macrococcus goetzii]RAI82531.1 DUF4411 family protein [Macrococcus goetzii]
MINNIVSSNKYLIDANSFIAPSKSYYPLDMVKSFWNDISDSQLRPYIFIIDKVKNEICIESDQTKKDDLQLWFENKNFNILSTNKPETILNYKKVLNHLKGSGYYKPSALHEWADINVADPWLIATAMSNNYTIVTFEKKADVNINNPMKRAKIPSVCIELGVDYCTIFDLMKEFQFEY